MSTQVQPQIQPKNVPRVIRFDQFKPEAFIGLPVQDAKAQNGEAYKKFPFTYDYNISRQYGNSQICDTLFVNLHKCTLNGIKAKKPTDKQGNVLEDKREEFSVMISFPLQDEKAQACVKFFEHGVRPRIAQLLDDPKTKAKLEIDAEYTSTSDKDVRQMLPLNHYVYYKRDKNTKELIPGKAPSRFLKLLDYDNFKTQFTLPDGTELTWDFLKDKKITGIPCIQLTYAYANSGQVNKISPQFRLFSMVVTDFDELKPEDRQGEARKAEYEKAVAQDPNAMSALRARISKMMNKDKKEDANPLTSGPSWNASLQESAPTPTPTQNSTAQNSAPVSDEPEIPSQEDTIPTPALAGGNPTPQRSASPLAQQGSPTPEQTSQFQFGGQEQQTQHQQPQFASPPTPIQTQQQQYSAPPTPTQAPQPDQQFASTPTPIQTQAQQQFQNQHSSPQQHQQYSTPPPNFAAFNASAGSFAPPGQYVPQ